MSTLLIKYYNLMCAHVGSVNGLLWPLTEGGHYVNVIGNLAASQAGSH